MVFFIGPVGTIGLLLFTAFQGIIHGLVEIAGLILDGVSIGLLCIAAYIVHWWYKNERPSMWVSWPDLKEILGSAFDDFVTRCEARAQVPGTEEVTVNEAPKDDLEQGTDSNK